MPAEGIIEEEFSVSGNNLATVRSPSLLKEQWVPHVSKKLEKPNLWRN
jgi:hypothetical protein